MQAEMWYPDTPGQLHDTNPAGGLNKGLTDRLVLFRQSHEFVLNAPIHSDMFQQSNILINDSEIMLRLYKSHDKFTCMSANDADAPRIEINDITLQMCQLHLMPEVSLQIDRELNTKPAIYKIHRTDMFSYVIQSGNSSAILDNIFPSADVPDLLVVALIKTADFDGTYQRSPLALYHNQLTSIGVYVNNIPSKRQPLKANFHSDQTKCEAVEAYTSIFTALNVFGTNNSNAISYFQFLNQYTLYCFNLSPVAGKPLPRKGVVKLDMNFREPLPENVYAIIMSKRNAEVLIDKTRQVSFRDV